MKRCGNDIFLYYSLLISDLYLILVIDVYRKTNRGSIWRYTVFTLILKYIHVDKTLFIVQVCKYIIVNDMSIRNKKQNQNLDIHSKEGR